MTKTHKKKKDLIAKIMIDVFYNSKRVALSVHAVLMSDLGRLLKYRTALSWITQKDSKP